jgi:hypothetical protein
MMISDEYIEEFQKIYEQEFGEKISHKEAYDKFLRLVNFMRVIYYPERIEGYRIKEDRTN